MASATSRRWLDSVRGAMVALAAWCVAGAATASEPPRQPMRDPFRPARPGATPPPEPQSTSPRPVAVAPAAPVTTRPSSVALAQPARTTPRREPDNADVPAVPAAEETLSGMKAALSREEVDRRIREMLRDAFWEGAGLYNDTKAGDVRFTRSAYYFQGTVKSLLPLLDHHPELQQETRRRLERADREKNMDDRAWKMRGVMVHVWKEVSPMPTGPGPVVEDPLKPRNLWERLGREKKVRKMIGEWIDESIADERVNFFRSSTHRLSDKEIDELKSKLVALTSDISGGPIKYRGKLLKKVHAGMNIRDDELDAMISHLHRVMIRYEVAKEDRETILGAIKFVRRDIVTPVEAPPPPPAATLWDRLGGTPVVTKVVNDWIDACVADRRYNFFREGDRKLTPEQIADLKLKLVQLASSLSRGPHEYRGRNLTETHQRLKITSEEFEAMVSHLKVAMVKHEIKPAEMDFVLKAMGAVKEKIVRADKN